MRNIFSKYTPLGQVAKPRQGMASSDDQRFVRSWPEVNYSKLALGCENEAAVNANRLKWVPYDKGGAYRKWYGNNDHVVNWENQGKEVLGYATELYGSPTRTIKNISMYFKEGITWSAITSSSLSVRYSPVGHIFSNAGMKVFNDDQDELFSDLALLNSKLSMYFASCLSQTINFDQGIISRIPVKRRAGVQLKVFLN